MTNQVNHTRAASPAWLAGTRAGRKAGFAIAASIVQDLAVVLHERRRRATPGELKSPMQEGASLALHATWRILIDLYEQEARDHYGAAPSPRGWIPPVPPSSYVNP